MTGPSAASVRTAALPGGRVLTVRRTTPDDADELARLYDELSDDDRYRRFFSLYRPGRAAIEQWAADNDHGKIRLAAFVGGGDPPGEPQLVGDALCVPLPDGDGEFALAVAADWRGWLGAYLLDTLAEVATDTGIRNLQADILTQNRRMLAVVQARGYAVLSHPCGFQVITCPGPGRRCPVLDGRPCPLALGADAIVFAVPADDPDAPQLAAGHARLHAGVPLCLIDRPGAEPTSWLPGALHVDVASLDEGMRPQAGT